jgi:site-specific DNA-methyltransferase (cytosine-N4-specific)
VADNITLESVLSCYKKKDGPISNEQLYLDLSRESGLSIDELNERVPIGEKNAKHSKLKRKVRWIQQTLKHKGVLSNTPGERGVWELSEKSDKGLSKAPEGSSFIIFETNLGASVWGNNQDVIHQLDEPINLIITSPPYPLLKERDYGNVAESEYVDFICRTLEPAIEKLADGASVVLNVSNDIFIKKSPARSLYIEYLIIALHERLGLSLMDRIPWVNPSKPPGPTYWACVKDTQLCSGWEPLLWFTNNPQTVKSCNRSVLVPHTENHIRLMNKGGDSRNAEYGDGAYKLRKGVSFANKTEGKIPKNVLTLGHACKDTKFLHKKASELNLARHPATFPSSLPDFLIQYLTTKGDFVLDLFAGYNKVGLASERLGRKWLAIECILDYVALHMEIFREYPGFRTLTSV